VTSPQNESTADHADPHRDDEPPTPPSAAAGDDAPEAVAKGSGDVTAARDPNYILDRFEEALAEGHIKQADALYQRMQRPAKKTGGGSTKPMSRHTRRRLVAAERRLRELQGWQRWSTRRARRELIATVEQLTDSDLHPNAIAEQIRVARQTWKSWDKAGDPANKVVWHRFDAACTRAYERPKQHFEAQAEIRRTNLGAKQTLCAQFETLYEQTDWKHPSWRELDKSLRQMRAQWRELEPVDHKHRKRLQQQLDTITAKFEDHLERERKRDSKRREDLIERARKYGESGDKEAALRDIKQLQRDWSPTVLSSRKHEDRMWREFRQACDSVFKQYDRQREATKRAQSDNEQAMQEICRQLDNLAPVTVDDLGSAQHELSRLTEQWYQITEVSGGAAQRLKKQFRAACRHAARAVEHAQRESKQQQLLQLRDKAALCAELETAALTASLGDDELATIIQRWNRLAELDPELEAAIALRFDLAKRAAAREAEAEVALRKELRSNLDEKNALCLQLEILAEIDSPVEFAKQRMAFQVQRLAAAMGARQAPAEDSDDTAALDKLTQQYWLSGAVPSAQYAALEARFGRARQALNSKLSSALT